MSDNHVTLVGNLTRDPELRFSQNGNARCLLGLAVNRRWFSKAKDNFEEQVSFFNVVAWGNLGENVSETCSKGMRVAVTGRLEQRSWETDDGERRTIVEVVADDIAPSLRWASAEVTRNSKGAASQDADRSFESEEEPF